jgi:thiamine biosynthesis protein ThiS
VIRVTVNGEGREIDEGLEVEDLLRHLGLDPARVAVERNREVLARGACGGIPVEEGDSFEIVQIVGGG